MRVAGSGDLAHLGPLEGRADAVFEPIFGALGWGAPQSGEARASEPGFLLVADDPPVGFVHVLLLDGAAHLEQLAVEPVLGRRGIGTALVEAACAEAGRRGHDAISLCTYADVPWNAPFYRRVGFEEVGDLAPFQAALRETERRLGLDRHGRRVVMERRLRR
ncbi:GNAT family N-acetyltransferase [Nocardioides aestuarii]